MAAGTAGAQSISPAAVREVIRVLGETYHSRGSVELGDPYKVLVATVISARTSQLLGWRRSHQPLSPTGQPCEITQLPTRAGA